MRTLTSLLIVLLTLSSSIHANDWDPEGTTYDPSIQSVNVNGASRPGDPTPFYKEGLSVLSFTSVEAKLDPNLGSMIWLNLIVPFVPGQTGPQEGDSLYLSIPQAEDLIEKLQTALENAEEEKDLGPIYPEGERKQWTVMTDPRDSALPIVLEMEENEERDRYHFGINPTKKLIDTLQKVSEEAAKLGPGAE